MEIENKLAEAVGKKENYSLEDVLVAIKKTGKMLSVEDTGNFRTYPDGCRIMDGEYMPKWQLTKPLQSQSDETKIFLADLILNK